MPLWECVHACSFRNFAESVIFRPSDANKKQHACPISSVQ